MLCEKCNINKATRLCSEIKNGVELSVYLCDDCLNESQNSIFEEFDMFSGFINKPPKKIICKTCATPLNKVTKTLFVGCPDCYNLLAEYLNPIIKNIQGATTHVGSYPVYDGLKSELEYLKHHLDLAVKNKRFEDAVILNKKIKNLENSIYGNPNFNEKNFNKKNQGGSPDNVDFDNNGNANGFKGGN